jgi:hypothetical protein
MPAHAQLAGSNLLIGQLGNWPPSLPDRGNPDRESVYDRLDLQFVSGSVLAGARFETDRNSDADPGLSPEYEGFTRRFADWRQSGLHVRVGSITTILGRGLIHRSFEIPGVVLEETGFRTRYTPLRDVDGVLGELERGPVSVRMLSGAPSEGTVSLAKEQLLGTPRHAGHISGAQVALSLPRQARVGAAVLRSTGGVNPATGLPRQHSVGTGFVEVDPLRAFEIASMSLPTYVEYAQEDRTFGQWWAFAHADRTPHALYAGTNLLWGPVTLSLEWKDYAQFRLGTNDPPSLIREHTAVLLNRHTHVLLAQREEGYQAELSWLFRDWATLVLNRSRADGARGDRFEEAFVELRLEPQSAERWEGTVFVDRSADSTEATTRRDTYGFSATTRWARRWSATLDVERQTAARLGFIPATFSLGLVHYEDVHVSLGASLADAGSLGFSWARTTDPLDPSQDAGRTAPLHLVGWNASARVAEGHDAVLFMGKRRGGLACTAGTCYQVLPFEGTELRLVSRF